MTNGPIKRSKSAKSLNPAPNKAAQKEQDLDARMAKAGRTRTPGWAKNSQQNKLQQKIARKVVDRSDDKRSGKKRTKARSSSKKYENQK